MFNQCLFFSLFVSPSNYVKNIGRNEFGRHFQKGGGGPWKKTD